MERLTLVKGLFLKARIPVAALSLCVCTMASAVQEFPTGRIILVVGYPAGGFSDVLGRVMANALSKQLDVPVIVENRTGAGGIIGSQSVARADADGYTLLLASPPHATSPLMQAQLPYKPADDFEAISLLATTPSVLVTPASLPYRSLSDVVEAAKASPGTINYASNSIGSSAHLSMELFKLEAGRLDITHVPYRGSAQVLTDIISGRVALSIDNVLTYAPYIKEGKLRPLAAVGSKRSQLLPDVPTFSELGYPNVQAQAWYMLLAPKTTPAPVIERLNQAAAAAMKTEEVTSKLVGAEILGSSPQVAADYLREEVTKWSKVIKEANVRID